MPETQIIRSQLLNISSQLDTATPEDLVKVISLLAIASHHIENSGHPERAQALYVIVLTQKVMEKYNDMIIRRPLFHSARMDENFKQHLVRAVTQLNDFASKL